MTIRVTVDDFDTVTTEREGGMSVGNAIDRATAGAGVVLPPRNDGDTVKVDGQPANYRTILGRDKENAHIEVETERCREDRAGHSERVGPPRRRIIRPGNRLLFP